MHQMSFRDYVKKSGLPSGECNYEAALRAVDEEPTKEAQRMHLVEAGMASLKQKMAAGKPDGLLTINEVIALQHMGINPLKQKVERTKQTQGGKELKRRKTRKKMKRASARANRKRK